jgi:PIN domain nuclease of toxin-antitoxin system
VKVLLDTCAVLWAVMEPEKLSSRARTVLSEPDTRAMVSPMSCVEIACAVERGRVILDRHWRLWFRHFIEENDWDVATIDLRVVEEAYSLADFQHRDPVDRLVVATARVHSCPVVTADRRILDYPHVDTIW